jgi:hypothetical protein
MTRCRHPLVANTRSSSHIPITISILILNDEEGERRPINTRNINNNINNIMRNRDSTTTTRMMPFATHSYNKFENSGPQVNSNISEILVLERQTHHNRNNKFELPIQELPRSISWTDLGSAFENMSWADGNSLIDSQQQQQQHVPPTHQQQQQQQQQQHAGESGASIATLRTLEEDDPTNLMLPPQPAAAESGRNTSSSGRSRSGGSAGAAAYYSQPRSRMYSGGGASIKDGGASVASMMSINSGNVSLGSIMSDISETIAALDLAEPNMRLLDQFGANL